MKTKQDSRLWIDRIGVRMDEPRDRHWIGDDQTMVSTEYVGKGKEELLNFREAVEAYFEFCKQAYMAAREGQDVSDFTPPDIIMGLYAPAPKRKAPAKKKEVSNAETEAPEAQQDS